MSGPAASDVLKGACKMMSDYLLESEGLSQLTPEELMEKLELTRGAATGVLGTSFFMAEDGYSFCKALQFDIGIAVRKPDGTELIFYPARNFGLNSLQSSPKPAKQEAPPTTIVPITRKGPIGFLRDQLYPKTTQAGEVAAAPEETSESSPGLYGYEEW